jgi:hypothetical protein
MSELSDPHPVSRADDACHPDDDPIAVALWLHLLTEHGT